MGIINKKYLDYQGLNTYDELSKTRTTNYVDTEVGAVVDELQRLENHVDFLAKDSTEIVYVACGEGETIKSGVTYYRLFGTGEGEDPRYEALPYTDTSVTPPKTWPAPTVGSDAEGYYTKQDSSSLSSGVTKKYIDEKFKKALEGAIIYYPVYYVMKEDPLHPGTYVQVFDYTKIEEHKAPEAGVTYYERKGKGSTADPYYYEAVSPAPADVYGYYLKGDEPQTTIQPTAIEKYYPVIDETTGNQVLQPITYVDESTTTTVINTLADTATIPDNEIIDLFE